MRQRSTKRRHGEWQKECVNMSVHSAFRNRMKSIAAEQGVSVQEFTRRLTEDSGELAKALERVKNRGKNKFNFGL